MTIFQELSESKLYPSKNSLKKYNLQDVANHAFLSCCALVILNNDFNSLNHVRKYLHKTHKSQYMFWNFNITDLYISLHLLFHDENHQYLKKDSNNELFFRRVTLDKYKINEFFQYLKSNNPNPSQDRRFLLKFEQGLSITDSSYKSIRRLVQDWNDLSSAEKQLTMTRLLQYFRNNARNSDLLWLLEKYSRKQRLELKNVQNPERNHAALKGAVIGGAAGYFFGRKSRL